MHKYCTLLGLLRLVAIHAAAAAPRAPVPCGHLDISQSHHGVTAQERARTSYCSGFALERPCARGYAETVEAYGPAQVESGEVCDRLTVNYSVRGTGSHSKPRDSWRSESAAARARQTCKLMTSY